MIREKKPRKPRKSACKPLKIVMVPGEPLSATEAEELEEALARFLVDTYRARHGGLSTESPLGLQTKTYLTRSAAHSK